MNKKFKVFYWTLCFGLLFAVVIKDICVKYSYNKIERITETYTYEYQNEDLEDMVKYYKEAYDIDIYLSISAAKEFGVDKNVVIETNPDEEVVYNFLKDTEVCLNRYTQKGLDALPKKWFILEDMYFKEDEDLHLLGQYVAFQDSAFSELSGYGLTFNMKSYELDPERNEQILHHEIFHAIDGIYGEENVDDKFSSIDEKCSSISDYACTNLTEEKAEAWSYAMSGFQTDKGSYLTKTYEDLIY